MKEKHVVTFERKGEYDVFTLNGLKANIYCLPEIVSTLWQMNQVGVTAFRGLIQTDKIAWERSGTATHIFVFYMQFLTRQLGKFADR